MSDKRYKASQTNHPAKYWVHQAIDGGSTGQRSLSKHPKTGYGAPLPTQNGPHKVTQTSSNATSNSLLQTGQHHQPTSNRPSATLGQQPNVQAGTHGQPQRRVPRPGEPGYIPIDGLYEYLPGPQYAGLSYGPSAYGEPSKSQGPYLQGRFTGYR